MTERPNGTTRTERARDWAVRFDKRRWHYRRSLASRVALLTTLAGGIVVALAESFGLPLHAVGVGEKAEDLRPFSAEDFARGLVGDGVRLTERPPG